MRSFVKINALLNVEITLSITDIGKSCLRCEFLTLQACLLTLFVKTKFVAKISRFTVFLMRRSRNFRQGGSRSV